MKTAMQNLVAAAIFLLATGACVSNAPEPVPLEQKLTQRGFVIGQQVNRIKQYQINGWNGLDRRNLILNIGVSRNYLVTFRTNCDGLQSAESIAFKTTLGDLTERDTMLVRGSGRILDRCYVESIHVLKKIRKPGKGKGR